MTIRVDVTNEDIKEGYPGAFAACPVALAFRRRMAVPTGQVVAVAEGWIRWGEDLADCREARYPESVDAFIDRFDDGGPVSPFSFDLEVPDAR